MCILHIVFCTVCKYVLSICKLLLFFCTVCPYVNCCCFFLHCLEHCKCSSAVFCTVCPYVNCLLFFCTVCPYVNCLLFFCTVWSTLIRISLTKALVLWWCDNKSDLIWFWFDLPWSSTLVLRKAASSAHSCTPCTHTTVQLHTAPMSSSNLLMTQRW